LLAPSSELVEVARNSKTSEDFYQNKLRYNPEHSRFEVKYSSFKIVGVSLNFLPYQGYSLFIRVMTA
jgi:hypothetical protein